MNQKLLSIYFFYIKFQKWILFKRSNILTRQQINIINCQQILHLIYILRFLIILICNCSLFQSFLSLLFLIDNFLYRCFWRPGSFWRCCKIIFNHYCDITKFYYFVFIGLLEQIFLFFKKLIIRLFFSRLNRLYNLYWGWLFYDNWLKLYIDLLLLFSLYC